MDYPDDIQDFLFRARRGDRLDPQVFVDYTRRFSSIILWGAGNLGTAIGLKMLDLGIPVAGYWDTQADRIRTRNGLEVAVPFSGDLDKDTTLIIFCIGNVAMGPNVFRQLAENGWNHVLHGNDLLQGLLCPLSTEGPALTRICNQFDICSVCSCERLDNIVRAGAAQRHHIDQDELLSFDRVHFIVNNVCNLKCKHCFIYINSYRSEWKQNVPLGQMLQDIDVVMGAVHSFGVVNIFGGEPFLRKDIGQVVERVLAHDNFGAVIVNTNGTVPIDPSQLASLKDERIRLAFSNYLEVLDEDKRELFHRNLEVALAEGVNAKCQNSLPTWNMSSTLEHKGDSIETMAGKKHACGVRFLYVFNGKVFPCAFAMSIHDLRIADYPSDYLRLDPGKTPEQIRAGIRELIERTHYGACGHCEAFGSPLLTGKAAEQGFDSRYRLPEP
ncbi:MAG: Radical domain protein [Holophagaceae bacterium]|nr:Radical domain protein [Holophagaceae bacterium]